MRGRPFLVAVLVLMAFDDSAPIFCYTCNSMINSGCGLSSKGYTDLERYAVECINFTADYNLTEISGWENVTFDPACLLLVVHRKLESDQFDKKRLTELVHVRSCTSTRDACELLLPALEKTNTAVVTCTTCNSTLCNRASVPRSSTLWPAYLSTVLVFHWLIE